MVNICGCACYFYDAAGGLIRGNDDVVVLDFEFGNVFEYGQGI